MIGTLTYITLTEFRDNTPVSSQASLTDAETTNAIIQAQNQIDGYISKYVEPFADDQEYKFPTVKDDASHIPDAIKNATIFIASDILTSNKNLESSPTPTKEEWSGDSYRVDYSGQNSTNGTTNQITMPKLAVDLLKPWRIGSLTINY